MRWTRARRGATTTRSRERPPSSASTSSRSADSSCSGSARSSGSAARSGRTRTRPEGSQAPRSSARRCASSSLRTTTTRGAPLGTCVRRAARNAARAAAGTRRADPSGWGNALAKSDVRVATRRSAPPRTAAGARRDTGRAATALTTLGSPDRGRCTCSWRPRCHPSARAPLRRRQWRWPRPPGRARPS